MKSQLLEFPFVLATQGIHCPAESRMIVSWAAIFSPLMPGGCIKSSQCQWWSRLFSIGQLVWEEDGSLSKTTKLLLLDSLLQEVCIESGSDGSLALSSLGLSVCLVSHNLLYSGLKKATWKWNHSRRKGQSSDVAFCIRMSPRPSCLVNRLRFSQWISQSDGHERESNAKN